jgi:hypothetical protein
MVPGNYLKITMNKFKETLSNDFKAERLSNGFVTNSKAETWYEGLDPVIQGDWKKLRAEFLKQWPKETVPALSVEQHRACLRAEKLRREDIGTVVKVRGVDMTGHVAWANRILTLSALADDPSGAMIHGICDGMPPIMKKIVTGTFKTYQDFCDAVKAVNGDAIAVALADKRRLDEVEAETWCLRKEISNARCFVPDSPTAPLRASFGAFNIGRGAARAPQANANANTDPFAAGPMRGGNIFRRFQRGGCGGAVGFRANHLRMADLTRNTTGMLHHPDTAAGRTVYQLQVQAWHAANPGKIRGGDEFAPYPLTPGTDTVGTGECFNCGVRHAQGAPHPRVIVDTGKTYYHRVANHIICEDWQATTIANAANVPANINLVEAAATVDYPAHWVMVDSFDQGNGEGPEV